VLFAPLSVLQMRSLLQNNDNARKKDARKLKVKRLILVMSCAAGTRPDFLAVSRRQLNRSLASTRQERLDSTDLR